MEAYKFETIVQKDGFIHIPKISRFADREAEIFVIFKPKMKDQPDALQKTQQFLNKWSGLLRDVDPDRLKDLYLGGHHDDRISH